MMILALVIWIPAFSSEEPASTADETNGDRYSRSVVGLEVTYQAWDEDRPWAKMTPQSRSGSAVLLEGSYLLTDAQMVDHATLIQLATFGRTRPVEPRIVAVDPEVNLALLKIDDPEALEGLEPIGLAEATPTTGTLTMTRWRRQQLEMAAARITRFEVRRGWGGGVEHAFLFMRTDMAGGGWGEPVFENGALAGVTVSQSDMLGRAVPVEILRRFLERAKAAGSYKGFPALGVMWQTNSDPAVAGLLGQTGEPRGILIRQVPWGTSACGVLKPKDILLELDGQTLDAEGYYHHPRFGRLRFGQHLSENYNLGDQVQVRVLRDRKEQELTMTLRGYPSALDLIPYHRQGQPSYVVAGGLVIRELDVPYLRTWGKDWDSNAPIGLLHYFSVSREGQTPDSRRKIILMRVMPSPYNAGYEYTRDDVIDSINGRAVDSIEDVVEAFRKPMDRFHVLELSPGSSRRQIVLDATTLDAATDAILEEYGIPAAMHLSDRPTVDGDGECAGDF
jgi:S1-C subfamily serine protease